MDWVTDVLKQNGLAGAFIFVLLTAVGVLYRSVATKDKRLKDLHEQRATEREQFVRLLEAANTAAMVTANATEKRNDVLAELSAAISTQANAVDKFEDRVQGQAEMLKEKFTDFKHVVDSFGESNRVISGTLSEIRNSTTRIEAALAALALSLAQGR